MARQSVPRILEGATMNEVIQTAYSAPLVILAYLISVVGSYAALSATHRMQAQSSKSNLVHLSIAGIALGGIGVWSMHFVGMLSLKMDIGLGYSMIETVISLVAACAAAAWALSIVAKNPHSWSRLVSAGAMLGVGAATMHYLGMYGMRFGGYFVWSLDVVAISVLIAIVAATAALWLAFNTSSAIARIGAAAVMGLAVSAMHYTGMSAAEFICTTTNRLAIPSSPSVISVMDLPLLVITLAVGMACTIAADLLFDPQRNRLQTPRH
jgi:NO-binding membrane sensor protein with MHYT domain